MKRLFIKAIALILTICMVAGIPVVSFAENGETHNDAKVAETVSKIELDITHSELRCGKPITFTIEAKGLSATGPYKYRLHDVSRFEGNDLNLVVDPSKLGAYSTSNKFDFTFMSPGRYKLSFGVMDFGGEKIAASNKTVYITINDNLGTTVEQRADEIADKCKKECSTDYEKALWLHDWLLDNCKYDYTYTYCGAEGALLRGTGTCEAYHRAYEMLLARVGINTGRMEGNGHVWTAVKMDGDWYQVDVTWDDTGGSSDESRHMYFGLTDNLMKAVHSEHKVHEENVSESLENNYFIKSGKASEWAEKYKAEITKMLEEGKTEFDLSLINKPSYVTYLDTIKNTTIAVELSRQEYRTKDNNYSADIMYDSATGQECFKCKFEHKHDYKTKTTAGGYLRHGETYQKCETCGEETTRKCAYNGYSTLYAKSFKVSKGKKSFTAKWKKANKKTQKLFNGYQVQYSLNANMSGAKTVAVGKASKSKKIKGLAKKRTYYVRVRTYVNTKGTTFYSKWSARKAVKTK